MDRRYHNAFDQIHMSESCQARILAAASSAQAQEAQSTMKKPRKALKTMLLAAALAACLSAVAYASNPIHSNQLMQLAGTLNASSSQEEIAVSITDEFPTNEWEVHRKTGKDGSETLVAINRKQTKENHLNVTSHETTDADGNPTLEIFIQNDYSK